MHISQFRITNFRNITSEKLACHPHINLIEGLNGSGKTSFLEALYFLSHGRSFKANQLNRVIQQEKTETTLFAKLHSDQTIALQKNKNGQTNLRFNTETVKTQSQLTKTLPMQILHPGSFSILTSGAKYRCQLIDWGIFYNVSDFYPLWRKTKHLIRQRNALLKQNPNNTTMAPWNLELTNTATMLDQLRCDYTGKLIAEVNTLLPIFHQENLAFNYYKGWPESSLLSTLLQQHLAQDIKSGFTHYGPHRADLRITINHLPASDILSRGQQKLLILAIKLAQGNLFYQKNQTPCVYLIDDLLSELDPYSMQHALNFLTEQKAQVFITSIDTTSIRAHLAEGSYAQFTIEKGTISQKI